MNRGGPPTTLGEELAAAGVLNRARELHGASPAYDPSSSAPPPPREPGCDDGEGPASNEVGESAVDTGPAPNSPEDVGFTSPAPMDAGGPRHTPSLCRDCSARIFWAQILEPTVDPRDGSTIWVRKKKPDGRYKAMPVNADVDPVKGNVVLFHRGGEGIVCRVLHKGEPAPPGARLRTSHFASCPAAARRRRPR